MKSPIISIIVPVYNAEKYVRQCLDSLINQTLKNIQIICVNDGSTDCSLNILNEYAITDNRIIVLNQENAGVSEARNNGLRFVNGEYYMFLDSDDWLDMETCEITYKYAKDNAADCLMFSYVKEFASHSVINHIFNDDILIWEKSDVLSKFHRRLFGPIGKELARPQDMDLIVSPCMQLFKTEKYISIPFVDIREVGTFEDGLYQMEIYKNCDKFVYMDIPFYHYRKTNEVSITSKYKPNYSYQLLCLFDMIANNIKQQNLKTAYNQALENRIGLSVLGIGINQTHSTDSIIEGGKDMKEIMSIDSYKIALTQLDISLMPIQWKIFFLLAKYHLPYLLFVMLKCVEHFRTHKFVFLKS